MAEKSTRLHRHFILDAVTSTEAYRPPRQIVKRPEIPERDRAWHGGELLRQIDNLKIDAHATREAKPDIDDRLDLQVEFESFPDVEMAFESLARERSGIELLNVRQVGNRSHATVLVPDGKLEIFENLIRAYLDESKDTKTGPRNHRLLNAIAAIRSASLRALWTDTDEVFPLVEEGRLWWEIWLPLRGDRNSTTYTFRDRAKAQGISVAPGDVIFPERTVLLTYASVEEMQRSIVTLNSIAELRRAKETAEFFDTLQLDEQREWLDDLMRRMRFSTETEETPFVCLLDTGVNRGHPLLISALGDGDVYTVEPGWGTDDAAGHGTQMAGLALAGNLTDLLADNDFVEINHRLESVKLLPKDGATGSDPRHHGYLTVEGIARTEVTKPLRHRVFGMAVTARDNRDRGRPSAWSSAIDSQAADVEGYGRNPRLLVVSAGNVDDNDAWSRYPDSNDTDGIHDPAQAWNALTVGAYTNLDQITEPDARDFVAVAPRGGLSPFSTTSLTWQRDCPLKPEIVLEGGNAAKDSLGSLPFSSLSLLTTHHLPADRLFTTINATSAATALASPYTSADYVRISSIVA